MGMGYAGGYADVIEEKIIKKICPKEYEAFTAKVLEIAKDKENVPVILQDLAEDVFFDQKLDKNIAKSYKDLCNAFEKNTDLKLIICYHDSEEEGSRYDDVDGIFWQVDGMYQLSPAGERMKKMIQRKSFVVFG